MREPDEVALVRLSRLTRLQYDRVRQAEAKKLGIKVSTLDEEVRKRRKRQKQSAEAPRAAEDAEDLEDAAHDIVTSHTVLDRFAEEIGKRVAGEEANLKRLYLIATSRLFEKTMHAAIKGLSLERQIGDPARGARLHSAGGRDLVHHAVGKGAALHARRLRPQDPVHGRGTGRASRTSRTICCAN